MKNRRLFAIVFIITILFFYLSKIYFGKRSSHNEYVEDVLQSSEVESNGGFITNEIQIGAQESNVLDKFDIEMIYPTDVGGKTWYSNWNNKMTLRSGERSSDDQSFIGRGNGKIEIDGNEIAHLIGVSPRMYVYDPKKIEKWNNVEVTVYSKRISETGTKSSQGIVIGARSEHQDATLDNPCLGRTYYGRLLYDGRAVFQKEVIHEGAYSINKPTENNKADWSSYNNTFPRDTWIGVKFVVRTSSDRTSVKLELYRDLTDGKNGGDWIKVAEYTDYGDWTQTDSGADVQSKCGYSAGKILIDAGTSVFIRNDLVKDVQYKKFSIREIR